MHRLRAEGAASAVAAMLERLGAASLDGFWVHVDVDVLDPALMPAVDSPDPGGIVYEELVAILSATTADPRCVGLEVAVFDPDLDPDGRLAGELTDHLVDAIRSGLAQRI